MPDAMTDSQVHAAWAKLAHETRVGVLLTMRNGRPFGSHVPYVFEAADAGGCPSGARFRTSLPGTFRRSAGVDSPEASTEIEASSGYATKTEPRTGIPRLWQCRT